MALPPEERRVHDPHEHERTSLSGLTEAEAREFHKYFVTSFLAFTAIALAAHILTYIYAPWGPNL